MENLDVMRHAVRYNRFLLEQIICAMPAMPHKVLIKVLDFGAGNGRFLDAASLGDSVKYAVETDPDYQRALRERPDVWVSSSLSGVDDNSIDLAWSFNVLEHIQDDQATLTELVAKLKPGGRLILFVPAFPCLYSRMDALVCHLRRYKVDSLLAKIELAGATALSVRYADSLGFFAAAAYRSFDGSGVLTPRSVVFYDKYLFPVSCLLDKVVGPFLGKNILVHAVKPLSSQAS